MSDRCRAMGLWCAARLALGLMPFAWGSWVSGQQISGLHAQSWSTEQGLPQDSVHQVYQDHSGFLWVATEGGVARFDGVNFSAFDHGNEKAFMSDDACCLAEDGNGDLWIGTADGLVRMHNQSFERFAERDGLPSAAVQRVLEDSDGSLLVLTAGGLVRRKLDRFVAVAQVPPAIDRMEPAPDGGVWLLGNGRGFLLKGDGVSPVAAEAGGSGALKGMEGGPGGAVWRFTSTEVFGPGSRRRWQVGKELRGSRVESLFVDRAGAAWVGTNDGVAVIEKNAVESVPSLRGNSVLQTFEDREGNYWIGTESSGLHVLRSIAFRTQEGTINQAVTAVVQGSGDAVWMGTPRDGLLRFVKDIVDAPVPVGGLTSPVVLSLAAGMDGSVWVGTPDGLNHVSAAGKVQRFTSADGLPDDYIQALAGGADGCVWIGTRQGLAHLCGSRIEVQTKANGLGGDLVGTLLLGRTGDLWIGTSGGLSRRSPDGRLVTYGADTGMPQGILSAMAEDAQGHVWVATRSGGLSRVAASTVGRVRGGLFRADVLGMVADAEGYLWLRRERGVDRVAIAELEGCLGDRPGCSPRVSHYGLADGLPSEEATPIGSPALAMLRDGELWVGTRRGVAIAEPGHIARNPVPPGVAIESFAIDGVPVAMNGGSSQIPYGGQRFTIEYAGLSFVVPSEVRYRFKLEGFDSEWTDAGSRRSATYTNLPPRRYTFRVQARNNDGVWNETGAALGFRIVPPYYRRWWFVGLVALALGAAASVLYRLRLRRLRIQFEAVLKERNRMAREIHDTLAQDFVGVTLQLDIISQMLGMKKVEAAVEQVRQARKLVTEGLAEARQSIWELRANSASDSLPTRLGRVVERYASGGTVIRTKIGGAFRPLDGRLEAEVLRVAQEALSNVQRHAKASNASVGLHYGRDTLVLTVEDDGRGFLVEEALRVEERYGLSGLQERANLLGGTLAIASEPGKGTRITLTTEISRRKDSAL